MHALLVLGALAFAPDYLTEVRSEPTPAAGTAAEIVARGEVCMAQLLGSGRAGGELIISRDPDGGQVVSRNAMSYMDGLLRWEMRSRVTLEARDGRFRITHSSIERNNDQAGGWSPVGKWWGSGWQKAEAALRAQTDELTSCINGSRAREDW